MNSACLMFFFRPKRNSLRFELTSNKGDKKFFEFKFVSKINYYLNWPQYISILFFFLLSLLRILKNA